MNYYARQQNRKRSEKIDRQRGELKVDKKMLSGYRSRVRRIEKLESDIADLKVRDVQVVAGKVNSSMKDFPYIQCHTTVEMNEPTEAARVKNVIKKKAAEVEQLRKMNQAVMTYIEGIEDPLARNIFEYYYTDGVESVTQDQIAERISMDRSNVAKIIAKTLKLSQNSHTSHF